MKDDETRKTRNGPWTIHSTHTAFENPWVRIETNDVFHPDGSPGTYGVVRYANLAIGVLPVDQTGHTWLVGQHRFPFDAYSWELPEGGGPKGEDPKQSAARELAEETGLRASSWLEIGQWHLSNSVTDERAIGYIAWGLEKGEARPEPSEDLKIERVPVAELVERCISGEITDGFTHLMVFAALARSRAGLLPSDIARHFDR